ncbi:hypothetical protein CHH28_11350 [Bacterioplanes sanyensis]|uniref:Inner membrane protein n=2 Tax=Bacterioplanes sanyensis TaxID=1249553 RepID=A0A222FQ48_9GAMM|nr:hypothetical protein CHH28_11350 [Bacterioplanes sanyensis]
MTEQKTIRHPLLRHLVFACGWLAVALGVIGIFLPVLPTTPFLLLAAACFLRTSTRFYQWLIHHPRLGNYVIYYLGGKGMPWRAKMYSLALMWSVMLLTAFVLVPRPMLQVLLPLIGAGVTIYILRLPTLTLK